MKLNKKPAKRLLTWALLASMSLALLGCSEEEEPTIATWEKIPVEEPAEAAEEAAGEEAPAEEQTEEPTEETPAEEEAEQPMEVPEGTYISELTGLPISESIRSQRPIAIMIDNDSRALPHYELGEADVVYELMNSTANNRITRLMAVRKDWGSINMMGSIRSTRPTNILLCAEWNAVLCHDGGPFYNDAYFNTSWSPAHFSGTFGRVSNGKATEFTEYCLSGDLNKNFSNTGTSRDYTANPGDHFKFAAYGTSVDLGPDALPGTSISLPFYNTSSKLRYNEGTGTYDYIEFGDVAKDGEDGQVVSFKNVLIQDCTFTQYDANGYMIYNCIALQQPGLYLTDGKYIHITWTKASETDKTHYYDQNGNELTINPGKTYIALIPSDTWGEVSVQ